MSTKEETLEKCKKEGNGVPIEHGSTIRLKRELGLFSAVNLILGVMIGSGIFVSPASALKYSGSVAVCLIIWTVSGVISLLGALSFAELGTVLGESGAEYAYFREAFGKMHRFWGPLPSFICAWIYVVILRPAEVAIIVMTFAEYAIQPFTKDLDPDYKMTAIKLGSLSALYISLTQENIADRALSYVEGLRHEMQNSNTLINSNDNLITTQFLSEMKTKTGQVDELIAFTKGAIFDTEKEIERLRNITQTAKEALSRPKVVHCEVRTEHLQKAKETFQVLKNELQGLIQSLFPQLCDDIVDVMGQLMQEKLNEETNGYIAITNENYRIIELLSDMNIVTTNPYNNMQIKLAY